ncbi:hypothetical protein PAT3040_03952 [Paenibacillus agaridevorans]|uniref:Uncharacterized protein n=1 Tax=Paenibacillus agaridevorans TaxID=171404 RepID=A0A2R5EW80_9BACL|nr:hypothetical protein PAT3040_03952 [Paenibacillus agaridevorans]
MPREEVSDIRKLKFSRRLWFIGPIAAIVALFLMATMVYIYEKPGGLADWRYSRATGLKETIRIPIGRTPEEAVQKFRDSNKTVVHKEFLNGGALLFLEGFKEKGRTGLQLEFVRETWIGGWKWEMGGGYGISVHPDTHLLNYMSMPSNKGIKGPFPIVFGEVVNPSVSKVKVIIEGEGSDEKEAKIVDYGREQRLWYAVLPKAASTPYTIEALDEKGGIIASQTFEDQTDSDSIPSMSAAVR